LVMGWLALRLRRLGGGVTAHVIVNSLAVLARSSQR
jgi:hypothetical protein